MSDISPTSPAPDGVYPTSPVNWGPAHRKFRRFQLEYSDPALVAQDEQTPIPDERLAPPPLPRPGPERPERTPGTSRLGLGVLAAALGVGGLCQGLLDVGPPGLNVLLCTAGLVLAIGLLARGQEIQLAGDGRFLIVPILFFAAAFAWRDSPTLKLWNGLALLAALALFTLRARAGSLRLVGLSDYALGGLVVGAQTTVGALLLTFSDIHWKEVATNRWYGPWLAIGRGVLLAAPLLILFGTLFMAADATFESLVNSLFRWNLADFISHLFMFGFWGWLAAGLLRQTFISRDPLDGRPDWDRGGPSLGMIELGLVLGALNLLFLAFVIVQVPYLFGGAATVLNVSGPTYSEYARRGFFELVTVTALVLPLLLLAHWLLRHRPPHQQRLFNLLAGSLVGLLFVIVASALQRMSLYRQIYGETELRLYTTAFMLWLAVVFVWFLLTVLRGHRHRFAFGALVSGFAALAVLNALNPDGMIVRANLGRELEPDGPPHLRYRPQPLDDHYLTSLSADAVPTLVELLPSLPPEKAAPIAARLAKRWSPPASQDWRVWNWGRYQAWVAVGSDSGPQTAAAPGR